MEYFLNEIQNALIHLINLNYLIFLNHSGNNEI